MPGGSRGSISSPKDFDDISAIWTLSCIDPDTILTYRGIAYRLKFAGWDAKEDSSNRDRAITRARDLVKGRAELFSPVVGGDWLRDWKAWVIAGKHYPGWVLETYELGPERDDAINDLTKDDVFRCQLRTSDLRLGVGVPPDPSTPRCTPEQIKLGLEHIDRLRKAKAESREWLSKFWVPVLALVVAVITPLVAAFNTWQTAAVAATDAKIRLYDLAARERGDAYESLLDAMQRAFDAAAQHDAGKGDLQSQLYRIRSSLLTLEPLIATQRDPDKAHKELKGLWTDEASFETFCTAIADNALSQDAGAARREFRGSWESMHAKLYELLFAMSPGEIDTGTALKRAIAQP